MGAATRGRSAGVEEAAGAELAGSAAYAELLADHVRFDLTAMRTKISTKGQIVLPAELRQRDRIEPGQEFEIERVGADEYRLVRLAPPPNQGLVDWLLSCPQGYFVPIESESTETL